MLDILLTVPHGAPRNDLLAPPVAKALHEALKLKGVRSELLISTCCRYKHFDMNRNEGRGSEFRSAINEAVTGLKPTLVMDVHSFPGDLPRYWGQDIALLHTPGLQCEDWLREYARALSNAGLNACVQPSEYPSDLLESLKELGVGPKSMLLAEHNNNGDPQRFAEVHAEVIAGILKLRRRGVQGERRR